MLQQLQSHKQLEGSNFSINDVYSPVFKLSRLFYLTAKLDPIASYVFAREETGILLGSYIHEQAAVISREGTQ